MVRTFPAPVYCYHEIVHNKLVVNRFEDAGRRVRRRDRRRAARAARSCCRRTGRPPRSSRRHAHAGSYVVDSVCPLVTKVHHEVKVRAGKGYRIVYIGHEGHEEAVGTMAVAPDSIDRVESVAEVAALAATDEPVALLAQTTLSHRDWEDVAVAVKGRFPDVWTPGRSDLCFATTNRQAAIEELAHRCDAIVVIGSANSSNTVALERLARHEGCDQRLPGQHRRRAARRSGGRRRGHGWSIRPRRAGRCRHRVPRSAQGCELVIVTDEDEYFPPPRNIRELQASIEDASTVLLGGSLLDRPRNGRSQPAGERRARQSHSLIRHSTQRSALTPGATSHAAGSADSITTRGFGPH